MRSIGSAATTVVIFNVGRHFQLQLFTEMTVLYGLTALLFCLSINRVYCT